MQRALGSCLAKPTRMLGVGVLTGANDIGSERHGEESQNPLL